MSNAPIPTPHISAKANDFAKTVLMPGDPRKIYRRYLSGTTKTGNCCP